MRRPQSLENYLMGVLGSARPPGQQLERVHLTEHEVLLAPGEPQRFVYFPSGCLLSILAATAGSAEIEVGAVGLEGFIGLPVFLDTDWGPRRVICQIEGDALRISVDGFRSMLRRTPALATALGRYTGARLFEATELLACSSVDKMKPRLARWLLMAADRVWADEFRLTQDFLARMLGVRRPYLNTLLRDLQRGGAIRYQRGQIHVLDRGRLEAQACDHYRIIRDEYARLLPIHWPV